MRRMTSGSVIKATTSIAVAQLGQESASTWSTRRSNWAEPRRRDWLRGADGVRVSWGSSSVVGSLLSVIPNQIEIRRRDEGGESPEQCDGFQPQFGSAGWRGPGPLQLVAEKRSSA